jgi:dTDP-D-glucose 4,6-dehydratase
VNRLRNVGWAPRITLEDGIKSTYDWYVENAAGAEDGSHEPRPVMRSQHKDAPHAEPR